MCTTLYCEKWLKQIKSSIIFAKIKAIIVNNTEGIYCARFKGGGYISTLLSSHRLSDSMKLKTNIYTKMGKCTIHNDNRPAPQVEKRQT